MNEFPDYLSPAVARALHLAQKLAGGEHAIQVEATHVAVALLAGEPEGLAADDGAFRETVLHASAELISIVEPLEISADREHAGSSRIIDANVNRAREAARVLEDYARFVLDDAGLSRSFKEMRHQLRELPEQL